MSLSQAPVLSTPDSHIFEDPTPIFKPSPEPSLSDEQIYDIYEVARTAREIAEGGWQRIALQFPDAMLGDGVKVFESLEVELTKLSKAGSSAPQENTDGALETNFNNLTTGAKSEERHRLYILADTSYGACCVDEIAAEHVDAEVVVHYGRSCLSPTARLPVIYVFTSHPLPLEPVIEVFENTYKNKEDRIILMADITYHSHIPSLHAVLQERGWEAVLAPATVHDPSSQIPNRKLENISAEELKMCSVFHISDPPPALLLTLSSRVKDLSIYPTTTSAPPQAIQSNTALTLRRRYALLTSLSTCPIFGILINTLSVRNYLETVNSIKQMIEHAGKKSYTFVVGKVNAAKIANFEEVGGWVVIGCWESSLIESRDFYRPIITPFELSLALQGDAERLWTGEWRGDFDSLETDLGSKKETSDSSPQLEIDVPLDEAGDEDSEEESAPPEFDLRTGRYVSHSRPMRSTPSQAAEPDSSSAAPSSTALTRRARGDLATVNGAVSPGAEYLRSQRTWTGLGSDFHEGDASLDIEEGRSGVARGYTVGEGERR